MPFLITWRLSTAIAFLAMATFGLGYVLAHSTTSAGSGSARSARSADPLPVSTPASMKAVPPLGAAASLPGAPGRHRRPAPGRVAVAPVATPAPAVVVTPTPARRVFVPPVVVTPPKATPRPTPPPVLDDSG